MFKTLAYGLGNDEIVYIYKTIYALKDKEEKTSGDLIDIENLKYLASLPTLNDPYGCASDIFKDVFGIRPHGFEFVDLAKELINSIKED